MSDALERMSTSVFNNSVPDMWANKAYPSLKPLGSWVADLLQVLDQLWTRMLKLLLDIYILNAWMYYVLSRANE